METIINDFKEAYSYICVSESVLVEAYKVCTENKKDLSKETILDLMADYILSQGLEEEIEL